jgi:hypothetical protein
MIACPGHDAVRILDDLTVVQYEDGNVALPRQALDFPPTASQVRQAAEAVDPHQLGGVSAVFERVVCPLARMCGRAP